MISTSSDKPHSNKNDNEESQVGNRSPSSSTFGKPRLRFQHQHQHKHNGKANLGISNINNTNNQLQQSQSRHSSIKSTSRSNIREHSTPSNNSDSTCSKINCVIQNNDSSELIICTRCTRRFHWSCIQLRAGFIFSESNFRESWKCPLCVDLNSYSQQQPSTTPIQVKENSVTSSSQPSISNNNNNNNNNNSSTNNQRKSDRRKFLTNKFKRIRQLNNVGGDNKGPLFYDVIMVGIDR